MLLKISKKILIIIFTLAFFVQFYNILYDTAYPSTTVSSMAEVPLTSVPFVFKICPDPAFNLTALQHFGYLDIYEYLLGWSRDNNQSLFGWAGHAENGSTFGDPQEIFDQVAFLPQPQDLLTG